MSDIGCSNIHYNYDIEMCNWLLKHGAKAIGCGIHNKTGNTSGTGKNTTSSAETVQKPGKVTGVKVYNSWSKKLRV